MNHNKLNLFLIIVVVFSLSLFFISCQTEKGSFDYEVTEKDKISKEEEDAIVYHAQQFIAANKSLRLEDSHRKIIKTTKPIVRIMYSGPKFGRIELEWPIAKATVLLLSARGKLLAERPNWVVEILTSSNKGGLNEKELDTRRSEDIAYKKAMEDYEKSLGEEAEGFGVD